MPVKVEDRPVLFALAGLTVGEVAAAIPASGSAAGLAEELGVTASGSDEEILAAVIAAAEGKTPKPTKAETPKAEPKPEKA